MPKYEPDLLLDYPDVPLSFTAEEFNTTFDKDRVEAMFMVVEAAKRIAANHDMSAVGGLNTILSVMTKDIEQKIENGHSNIGQKTANNLSITATTIRALQLG